MTLFNKRKKSKNQLSTETMKNGARLITAAEPQSPVSEQFRNLRTNIDFTKVSRDNIQTLLISSALASEGKSTVASNLAIAYAQQSKKILLVDADLRRPSVAATFGLSNDSAGLTSYLGGSEKEISSIVSHTRIENLDVMASGPIPPNPAELLGSSIMTELVTKLKLKYDFIIFDVPPFLMVTDAQVLISKIDAVVLVVNGEQTTKADLKRTTDVLKIADATVLGFVYNDMLKKQNGRSGYGYGNVSYS